MWLVDLFGRLSDRQRRLSDPLGWQRAQKPAMGLDEYLEAMDRAKDRGRAEAAAEFEARASVRTELADSEINYDLVFDYLTRQRRSRRRDAAIRAFLQLTDASESNIAETLAALGTDAEYEAYCRAHLPPPLRLVSNRDA